MKHKIILTLSIIIVLLFATIFVLVNKYKHLSYQANNLLIENSLMSIWGDQVGFKVINDEANKNIFFFSLNGDNSDIRKYDIKKDESFSLKDRVINLTSAENIFSEVAEESPLGGKNDIMLLGFDNEKLVFWNHISGDSPGPCTDPWIDRADNLFYIIPTEFKDDLLKKNKYTLGESEKQRYLEEQKECTKNI